MADADLSHLYAAPTEWIVAFEPRTSIWWNRFLAHGFGHCFAFGRVNGTWLVVEPLVSGTHVGIATDELVRFWFAEAKLGEKVLLAIEPQRAVAVRPRFMVTCAGCIASLLGLRHFPITPAGLFWRLRKMGARRVGRAIDPILALEHGT